MRTNTHEGIRKKCTVRTTSKNEKYLYKRGRMNKNNRTRKNPLLKANNKKGTRDKEWE